MKKLGFLLTGLAFVLAVYSGIGLYQTKQVVDVFTTAKHKQEAIFKQKDQMVFNPQNSAVVLDSQLVHILQGKKPGDKEQALQQIVEETLLGMHHKSWLKNGDVQANYLFGNIYKDAKEEFILAVNRGKDLGMVFVFVEQEDGFKLVSRLRGLVPVVELGLVGIPDFPYKGLVLEERLDEMTGGFFLVHTKSIYLFKDAQLNKVWDRVKYLQEYYPQGGQLQGEDTQWWLNREEVEIEITDKGLIKVVGFKKEEKSQSLGVMEGPYEKFFEEEIKENYIWNPRDLKFKKVETGK